MYRETLEGTVERVTFYSDETGYSVIRLQPHGRNYVVTVVGNLPEVNPGEYLRLTGNWTTHAQHGRQFKAEDCKQVLPATIEGIRKYLGSGLIKGVGPVTAERIVKKFGADTLRVIEEEPERLRDVLGVGPKRVGMIKRAWQDQKHIKEIMLFLQSHGVSTSLAVKIYKEYGDEAVSVVQTDPYRLARDIFGIGFKTADKIAQQLGLPPDAPSRVEAGVSYALSQFADDGHVYAPEPDLVDQATQLLSVPPDAVAQAIERLHESEVVRRELLDKALTPGPSPAAAGEGRMVREERAVYLAPFYYGELGVTGRLRILLELPESRLARFKWVTDWGAVYARLAGDAAVELSERQKEAIRTALTHKVSVLTGGPGTGKTTSLRALIRALELAKQSYVLASPTGRAAKRLSEATGRQARTVHRLLEFKPQGGFARNADHPLDADMVIIDESSMLDLLLTNQLLKAIHPASHVLFVGDVDQLPSVGAGDVLRDIIASGQVPVVRLDVIFRQAADSLIITNAHRVNQGLQPLTPRDANDFFLFVEDDPDKAADLVVDLVQNRIPRRFGFDALNDIQVLSPMHRGSVGVAVLNTRLQEALNPPDFRKPERRLGGRVIRVGDKVMQIRNNYDKDVYNGDIGRVKKVDVENQAVVVDVDGRQISYDWLEMDELVHAFAASVHKAQGSEYTAVVLPLLTQHWMMLQRNLLYTAITRARRLVVVVGTRKALAIAVKNDKVAERHSALDLRLAGAQQTTPIRS
jgi:exodeoxyribonuclease V alpha subunit